MKKNNPKITGVYAAITTPFKADESLDLQALKKLIDYMVEGCIAGILVGGNTGEFPLLDKDERKPLAYDCLLLGIILTASLWFWTDTLYKSNKVPIRQLKQFFHAILIKHPSYYCRPTLASGIEIGVLNHLSGMGES